MICLITALKNLVCDYFLITTHALCPPKPKVLLMATFTSLFCGSLNVKFNFGSSSGAKVWKLIVGGTISFFTANVQAIASTAPAPPKGDLS